MTCTQCGSQNPDVAGQVGFCCNCGASLSKLEGTWSPALAPTSSAPLSISAGKETDIVGSRTESPLPYIWGNIQGWIQIVWGIAVGLLALVSLYRGLSTFKMRIALLGSALLYLLTGIGILRKRSYSFVLVFICMILTVVMYYQVLFLLPSRAELLPVGRALYWILSFFYYFRRRRDLKPGW